MKVSSLNWGVTNPEQLYRQQDSRQVHKPAPSTPEVAQKLSRSAIASQEKIATQDLLTPKEMEALRVLFGYNGGEEVPVYGNAPIRNVHSGLLLDVKG